MSRWLVYAGFALDGLGVVLLGPLLPRLESQWRIGDAQGGALLAAMFFGMTAGTVLVLQKRRHAMLAGAACSSGGLILLAVLLKLRLDPSAVEVMAIATLFVYGFGLGQAITTLNLAAGAKPDGRSARLSFGNAMWSAGALISPGLMTVALRGSSLAWWLAGIALLFPLVWLSGQKPQEASLPPVASHYRGAAVPVVVLFCSLMFLYGSVESSLSGWVTTFAEREAHAREAISPLSVSAFWFGVVSGRVLAGMFLRQMRERQSILFLVGGASLASLGLVLGRSMLSISLFAAVCGIFIGPAFASIVSGVLSYDASPHQTGTVLAMSGAGATVMPFVLGLVSQRLNSLREALVVPGVCLVAMFLITLLLVRNRAHQLTAAG